MAHSKLRVWPTLAVSGPWISTRSGATGSWQRINFWRHTPGGNFHEKWHTDDVFVAFYNDALFTVAPASPKSLLVRDMMGKLVP